MVSAAPKATKHPFHGMKMKILHAPNVQTADMGQR